MILQKRMNFTSIALGATLMVGTMLPGLAFAGDDEVTIYFTRHAEKQALLTETEEEVGVGVEEEEHLYQPSGDKGAEELSEFGEKRAEALADWFLVKGITSDLTHIFSSQKLRTRQTIQAIAQDALAISGDELVTSNDDDYLIGDGIQQFPRDIVPNDYDERLETLDSPKSSINPTIEALLNLPDGSVALVAMHSGTFYKILNGLQIDSGNKVTDEGLFPKGDDQKISTFGDIWKIKMKHGAANVEWRKNLQFEKYKAEATYTP